MRVVRVIILVTVLVKLVSVASPFPRLLIGPVGLHVILLIGISCLLQVSLVIENSGGRSGVKPEYINMCTAIMFSIGGWA